MIFQYWEIIFQYWEFIFDPFAHVPRMPRVTLSHTFKMAELKTMIAESIAKVEHLVGHAGSNHVSKAHKEEGEAVLRRLLREMGRGVRLNRKPVLTGSESHGSVNRCDLGRAG